MVLQPFVGRCKRSLNDLADVAPFALKRRAIISAADLELELGQSSGSATDRALDELATTFAKLTLTQAMDMLAAAKDLAAENLAAENLATENLAAEILDRENLAVEMAGEKLATEKLAPKDVESSGQSSAGTLMDVMQLEKESATTSKEEVVVKRSAKNFAQEREKLIASPIVVKTLPSVPATKMEKLCAALSLPSKPATEMEKFNAAERKLIATGKAARLAGVKSNVHHYNNRDEYRCFTPNGEGLNRIMMTFKYCASDIQTWSEACEKAADWLQRQL